MGPGEFLKEFLMETGKEVKVSHRDKIGDVDAVVQDRADEGRQDDLPVLKAVDPAVVKDGDKLDNDRCVIGAHADDTTKPTGLENHDHESIGEVSKEGDTDSSEGEGRHPHVGEEGDQGTDVRVHLAKGTVCRSSRSKSRSKSSLYKFTYQN